MHDENSAVSDACKDKFNNIYDACIYSTSYEVIRNRLNCSFALFLFNPDHELQKNESNECEIQDVSSDKSATVFYDILSEANQGKRLIIAKHILNVHIRIRYSFIKIFHLIGEMSEEVSKHCSKACTYLDVAYGYPFIYDAKNGSDSL